MIRPRASFGWGGCSTLVLSELAQCPLEESATTKLCLILLLIEFLPRIYALFNLPGIRAHAPFLKGAYALCYVFVKGQSCRRIETRVARQAFAS
jgi:hypothetical protein